MTVQSARVQQVILGDDVTLLHQVVANVALDAVLTEAPVEINTGDVVRAFYPASDGSRGNGIGFLASPVGSLPSSRISVDAPGASVDVPPNNTAQFALGLGQTVRIEITRAISSKKESYYLFQEIDVLARGFPTEAQSLNLP